MSVVDLLKRLRNRMAADLVLLRAQFIKAGTPVSCKGLGCNGCCRGEVALHPAEWRDLLPHVPDGAWKRVREHSFELSTNSQHARCPLLDPDTGGCTVYEHRPFACRAYMVVTPVDHCYPERVGRQEVASPADAIGLIVLAWDRLPGGRFGLGGSQVGPTLGERLVAEVRARDVEGDAGEG